jgi:hypothetical protein
MTPETIGTPSAALGNLGESEDVISVLKVRSAIIDCSARNKSVIKHH